MKKTKTVEMSAKHKQESKALELLQGKHSYMFQELRHSADRTTMQYTRDKKTGKSSVTLAMCIKLIVPADSKLGIGICDMRKKKAKKGKR